jgi:type II secretory pathway pseudopilin PulG
MMLVLLVIALMALVALPDFSSLQNRQSLESVARRVVGMCRYARAAAISDDDYTYLELNFEERTVTFGHARHDDPDFKRNQRFNDPDPGPQVYELPTKSSFHFLDTYEELISEDGARLYFYPDGTASPAILVLAQERPKKSGEGIHKKFYTVEIYRATGLTRSYYGRPETPEENDRNAVKPLAGRREEGRDLSSYVSVLREKGALRD